MYLANNLAKQGKLIEAEQVARETLKESIAICGKESGYTGKVVGQLAGIKLAQGNLTDAEKLAHALIRVYERIGISPHSRLWGEARTLIGDILVARLDFNKAVDAYAVAEQMLAGNQLYQAKVLNRNRNRILALLKTGHIEAASEIIPSLYRSAKEFLGENNYHTAEALALRAMLSAARGDDQRMFEDFSTAMPVLFHDDFEMGLDYLAKQRRTILAQAYIELLKDLHADNRDTDLGVNGSDVAFQLVQNLGKGAMTGAANAAMARAAAAHDPALYELVRKEQDLDIQLNATQAALADAIAVQESPNRLQIIESRRAELETVRQAKVVLLDEIMVQFPKYTNFIRPKSVGVKDAQQLLQPEESLLIVFPMANRTYVWAIPYQGAIRFHSMEITQTDLEHLVSGLRKALTPQVDTLGDIPAFDVLAAYELYQEMLAPVADAWAGAKDLIVIASGSLGQLPFSLLPTSAPEIGPETEVLFSRYRNISWLIREVSLARMPSVSNFIAARQMQAQKIAERMFAGFGDPVFNIAQIAAAAPAGEATGMAGQGSGIRLRGMRTSSQGDLDNAGTSSVGLSCLNRLPDTAEEINAIARILNADLDSDVFLGKAASEHRVKTMNLADRRIIVFASHGLLPGDLDGLYEPAIALSAPAVTGEKEDGLLTMSEVLKLKLNADWIVLSACNTGAGKGAGAEAMSGLGRAFIYAGSRALLVSMWPVETTSAKQLTTGLFQYQKTHTSMSRSRALQNIMLDLIDNHHVKDPSSGQIMSSYAHPLFWAPFIVFGDGGK
ncbi:MAG: CHAT domain-containing protein [Desulfobacterales bacterium]|uniref:CHAT domain-containing protein n=1 Tax=Candidatus Desulfatibia vada TaxID=2841696 RepID=A0A8J6NQN9_9BACT|nr:CHAT domain-containing protein [Candidatus Desulfatibia vada]MBL6972632.1 CHAT domain-containing protein [Desulfobacterales bacterium]